MSRREKLTDEQWTVAQSDESARASTSGGGASENSRAAWTGSLGCRQYDDAALLFEEITTRDEYIEFLTLPAYELITQRNVRVSASEDQRAEKAVA